MFARCIAAGCSNVRSDTVSLFRFPKDPALRQRWTKQVKRTRANWKGPSDSSVLCSKHFTESCFEPITGIGATFGLKMRPKLKPDAVPTVFVRSVPTDIPSTSEGVSSKRKCCTQSAVVPKKQRVAYEKKRENQGNSQIKEP